MGIKLLPNDLPPLFSFKTEALGALYCFQQRGSDYIDLATKHSAEQGNEDWVRVLISVSKEKGSRLDARIFRVVNGQDF